MTNAPETKVEPRACWTVLPPIPLMGVGSELVESVEHYAARLAWVTGTSVRQLCALPPPFAEPGSGNVGGTNRFCGPGITYRRRIRNLEALTGVETIRCGSFLVLDEVLSVAAVAAVGRSAIRHRWCPECYRAWDETASWEPLIWKADLLTTCLVHGCDLETRCRECHAPQRMSARYERRRVCHRCGASLAGRGRASNRPQHDAWVQRQLCELVRFCATPGQTPIRISAYETFVEGLAHLSLDGVTVPAPVRAAVAHVRSKVTSSRVSLRTLINLCALQGVSIVEALVDPIGASSRPLIDQRNGYRSIELPKGRHGAKIVTFEDCAAEILRSCEWLYVPAMGHLLREIGLHRNTARELSVDLYEAYEAAHQQQGTQNELIHAERTFRCAMDLAKNPNFEIVTLGQIHRTARKVASLARVSLQQAKLVTRAAICCRKALEQAKARNAGGNGS